MVNEKLIAELVGILKNRGEKQSGEIEEEDFIAYRFNDLTLTFLKNDGKLSFYGIVFNLFGNDVMVSSNLNLMVFDDNESEAGEGFMIEDEDFIKLIEKYLYLRIDSIENFNY